jgi:hypothetical protein
MSGGLMKTSITIREVAVRTGVSVHTLRYYERAGLLPRADRSPAGYRLYTADSIRRVRLVRTLRSVGFGIRELKGLGAVAAERASGGTAHGPAGARGQRMIENHRFIVFHIPS